MCKCIVALAVLVSVLAAGQQSRSVKPHRIICTTPKGKVTKMVKPSYPSEAIDKQISGHVLLDIDINERGEPTDVRINPILAKAAALAVEQWRWEPLLLNGKAVPVNTSVQVKFELASKKKINKTT